MPNGQAIGFDVEVIKAAFNHLNIPVKFRFLPWKRVISTVKIGDATGMFSCAYTKKREQFVHYSAAISTATQGIVVNKNYAGPPLSSLIDLKKVQVASVAGYAANKILTDAGISFYSLPHISNGFPMLTHNRFDVLFLSLEAGRFLAAEAGLTDELKFMPLNDIPTRKYHLCFSKKWPKHDELSKKFNTALAVLRSNGQYDTIHARYR